MDIQKSKRRNSETEYREYLLENLYKENKLASTETVDNTTDHRKIFTDNSHTKNPSNMKTAKSREKTRKNKFGSFFVALAIFIILISLYTIFVFSRIYIASKKINIENKSNTFLQDIKSTTLALIPSQRKELLGEKDGRVNILLLGAAGEKKPGKNLTDTIMIASIDTKEKKIGLLSLPRDMYVKIPETKTFTKINGLYQYGLKNELGTKTIKSSVEEITDLPIHYYLVVDFDGFTKFIDALGGINVNVERDIYDPRYPGPNYSYETFELKKGLQSLNGETALKYVRERHDDPQGDFGRAKRQQQVMQSVKNKAFSMKTILNPLKINEILSALEQNIKTDMALDDIESLITLSKELDTQNISTKVVDAWKKDSLLKVSHILSGNVMAFILVPRAGNYSQIQELAENIFDVSAIENRKTEIAKENSSILIINSSLDASLPKKIKDLLSESMGIKNIKITANTKIQTQEQTLVFDMTQGSNLFTLDEIVKSVPATLPLASTSSAYGDVEAPEKLQANSESNSHEDFKKYDFVLVLGKDIVNSYKFEEDDADKFKNSQDSQEYFEITE